MSRKKPIAAPPVAADPETTATSLAKAVAEGDIVNFRMIFAPFSPARDYTSEDFASSKYQHLLADDEIAGTAEYTEALRAVKDDGTWNHIQSELSESRPPCLASGLLMLLADNALRRGKHSAAAQAYEMLRIREEMQSEFAAEANRLLEAGEIERAVKGFDIAAGLNYDYAGFPDPLPLVNDYQTRALMLHGEYPPRPQDCVAAMPAERFVEIAFNYLLNDRGLAKQLLEHTLENQLAFLYALIHLRDPEWDEFATRFKEACALLERFAGTLVPGAAGNNGKPSLQNEVDAEQAGDPWVLPVALLGRELEDAQWWQYLKELAVKHPAAPLFIARQLMGEVEILAPRLSADSPIPKALGLPTGSPGVVIATN